MTTALALLFLAFAPRAIHLIPLPEPTDENAAAFLARYGYMHYDPETHKSLCQQCLSKAIKKYQAFVGLNETGALDNDTVTKMNSPRCGVRDMEPDPVARRRRYSVHGSRWTKRSLTYSISKYSSRLTNKEVDDVIRNAFLTWSEVSTLSFTQKSSGPVDIEIRFEVGEHGDGKNSSFDGPGGSLAHAFFPAFGGAVHFDDDESWSLTDEGMNLYSVATHEIGHSLGLHHTDVLEAAMSPYYQYNDFGLHSDDIEGIQALYGKTEAPSEKLHSHPHDTDLEDCPDLCSDPSVDTIFTDSFMKTYIFKGDFYWHLIKGRLSPWGPRRINETWKGLPGNIDAAFTYTDGRTYFFKGSLYWGYLGWRLEHGFPKNISDELPGIPSNIDAAMIWGVNGKLYFFKGSEFWRFDPTSHSKPKPISSHWGRVPSDLDAAYTSPDGSTYFLKGNNFYKFDNYEFDVEIADPPFPRNLTEYVYNCLVDDYPEYN